MIHTGNIMTSFNIYIWPIVILVFILYSIFELIMKLLILIMILLLYVFDGKLKNKNLSLLGNFDSWNSFRYSLLPTPGKYDCCYSSFGSGDTLIILILTLLILNANKYFFRRMLCKKN